LDTNAGLYDSTED